MPDRTINFGESETEATYQIQDTDGAAGGGNFVVAKDTNANTVLLEYQPGSDTWQYAGDVDMGGGDITNVNGLTASSAIIGGTVTATDVNTDSVNTDELFSAPAGVRLQSSTQQTLASDTVEQLTWDQSTEYNTEADDFADLANDRIVIPNSKYSYARLKVSIRFASSITVNFADTQKNGGLYDGRAFYQPQQAFQSVFLNSDWVPISQGDAFITRVRQESGVSEDTFPDPKDTWFALEAI